MSFARKLRCLHGMRKPLLSIASTRPGSACQFSSRSNCAKDESPRCSPEKMANLKCESKLDSVWFDPKCCLEPCWDAMPRFDDIYYKPSDKDRLFTRTWVECPKTRVVKKKVCCYDPQALPPIERRDPRPRMGRSKCNLSPEADRLMKCHGPKNSKCPKWVLPRCKKARDPPRCFQFRAPSNCKKVCTPFPAFSECKRPKRPKRHPTECACLQVGPFCHVSQDAQK